MVILIIAVVLLVITTVYILIRQSKKKAETPCGCGTSPSGCTGCNSEQSVVKKLILDIEGMHCVRCQNGVSEALNSLDGVSATVDLENNCAKVELSKDVPEDELKQAIADRGFAVTAVKTE